MIEVILYMDVYGWEFNNTHFGPTFTATNNPTRKSPEAKRYAITVKIPDPRQVDAELPVHEIEEVDRDD